MTITVPTGDPGSVAYNPATGQGGVDEWYIQVHSAFGQADTALTALQSAAGAVTGVTAGTTRAVTTTSATQTIVIQAKIPLTLSLLPATLSLLYDGVAVDTAPVGLLSGSSCTTLLAVVSPGAAQTKNVTVTTSTGTLGTGATAGVKIMTTVQG